MKGPGVYKHYKGSIYIVKGTITSADNWRNGKELYLYTDFADQSKTYGRSVEEFHETVNGVPRFIGLPYTTRLWSMQPENYPGSLDWFPLYNHEDLELYFNARTELGWPALDVQERIRADLAVKEYAIREYHFGIQERHAFPLLIRPIGDTFEITSVSEMASIVAKANSRKHLVRSQHIALLNVKE